MKTRTVIYLLLLIPAWSGAQTVRFDGSVDHLDIGQSIQVMEDPGGRLRLDQVSSKEYENKFRPSGQNVLNFGITKSVRWLRVTIENKTYDHLIFEIAQAFLGWVDFYYLDSASGWTSRHAGYRIPLPKKEYKYHFQVFSIPRGKVTCYIRLLSYAHPLPVRLWERGAFDLASDRLTLFYGIYSGILLFVIISNLFLFFALHRFYYLHYAILVALYLTTSASVMEGYVLYLFPSTGLMSWYITIPAINMPVFLLYCVTFLNMRKFIPGGFHLAMGVTLYYISYLGWMHLLPLLTQIVVNQIHALSLFFLVTILSIRTGMKGNKMGYYFSAAYAIWFILVLVEVLYIRTGRPPYLFGISYVSIAIFTEVFLLAWLLALRFRRESREEQTLRAIAERELLETRQRFQQESLQARLEIQENTFNNISLEIHDNIGQVLSLAKLHLSTLDLGKPEDMQEKTQEARKQISRAILDLRNLSHTLNSDVIQTIGFNKAIAMELELIRKTGMLQVVYEQLGERRETDPAKELILFRIFQESLHNILRHAEASLLEVRLTYAERSLSLVVRDNGKGFDPNYCTRGTGISNMIKRSELVGAAFSIDSRLGEGTMIRILLPLN
jgi:signal transduction histidine kinase